MTNMEKIGVLLEYNGVEIQTFLSTEEIEEISAGKFAAFKFQVSTDYF